MALWRLRDFRVNDVFFVLFLPFFTFELLLRLDSAGFRPVQRMFCYQTVNISPLKHDCLHVSLSS